MARDDVAGQAACRTVPSADARQGAVPNEMYAALVETAGYVPVPLAAGDYIELLPATWREVNAYGVKSATAPTTARRSPYRRQHSG